MNFIPYALSFTRRFVHQCFFNLISFFICLGAFHRYTCPDSNTIVEQQLDGVEEVKPQQQQKRIFAFSYICGLSNVQHLQNIISEFCSYIGFVEVAGKLSLKEMSIDFVDAKNSFLHMCGLFPGSITLDEFIFLFIFRLIHCGICFFLCLRFR